MIGDTTPNRIHNHGLVLKFRSKPWRVRPFNFALLLFENMFSMLILQLFITLQDMFLTCAFYVEDANSFPKVLKENSRES